MKLVVAFFLTAAFLAPTAAFAGIGEELTVAQTQALLTYRFGGRAGRGAAQAQQHLHSVINCLAGPGGDGYDVTPPLSDPCAADKTNKGAVNDAASPAQKQKVVAALALAKAALDAEPDKLQDQATALADAIGDAK